MVVVASLNLTTACVRVQLRASHAVTGWRCDRHVASAFPIGVEGGPWTKGRVLMDAHPPGDVPAVVGADGMAAPGRSGRLPITVMLIAAATLDLTRCGIVLMTARHAASGAGLVAAGVAEAALSLSTARGCRNGRRWSGWATLLIGATGGRIRLPRALRDSQHRHCRPGNTSDRGGPGYPGPERGTRPIRREPVLVDRRPTR